MAWLLLVSVANIMTTRQHHPSTPFGRPFRGPLPIARSGGFGLLETIIAMSLIMLIAVSTTQAFLVSNRRAATNRALTAARTIVQRNLDLAMSVRFENKTLPPILALTAPAGAPYDDDENATDTKVNLLIQKTGNVQNVLVKGDLIRIVQAETNTQGADIRRVTFRLTFNFQRRDFLVEMTTFRAIDD
jgi:type II secretory pathway pseudopilin PulG